jgi:hypothetical protein
MEKDSFVYIEHTKCIDEIEQSKKEYIGNYEGLLPTKMPCYSG